MSAIPGVPTDGLKVSDLLWSSILNKPLSFPPSAHSHGSGDLPVAIAFKDQANTFTADQTISANLVVGGINTSSSILSPYARISHTGYSFFANGLLVTDSDFANASIFLQQSDGSVNAKAIYVKANLGSSAIASISAAGQIDGTGLYLENKVSGGSWASPALASIDFRQTGYWSGNIRTQVYAANYGHSDLFIGARANITSPVPQDHIVIKGDTGNVGIGTTTPPCKLYVTGEIQAQTNIIAAGNLTTNGLLSVAADSYLNRDTYFRGTDNVTRVTIAGNTGNITASGNIESTSGCLGVMSPSLGFSNWWRMSADGGNAFNIYSNNSGVTYNFTNAGSLTTPGAIILNGNAFSNGPSISNSSDGLLLVAGATSGVRINNSVNGVELFRVSNAGMVTALGSIQAPTYKMADYSYIAESAGAICFLTSGDAAKPIKAGSLVVSDSYGDTPPTNGIYCKGAINATGKISAATEYRLNNQSHSRVAQVDSNGFWGGGYNFNLNSGSAQRDSTGYVGGILYHVGGVNFYAETSGSPGAISPRMTLTPAALSMTGAITATGNIATLSSVVSGAIIHSDTDGVSKWMLYSPGTDIAWYVRDLVNGRMQLTFFGGGSSATASSVFSSNLTVEGSATVTGGTNAAGGLAVTGAITATGNVGIGSGATLTNARLSLGTTFGNQILLYDDAVGGGYGFGIQANLLQIFCNSSTDSLSLGYGKSSSFTAALTTTGTNVSIAGHVTSVIQSLSTDPTGSDLASGQTRTIKNTSTGTTKVWLNDGGTFKSITFA